MRPIKYYLAFFACILSFQLFSQSRSSSSNLHVTILDQQTEEPCPVRVKVTDANGHATPLPAETISIMYGRDDRPERYGYQPDSSFYVDGAFSLALPAGEYTLQLSKGMEYLDQTDQFALEAGQRLDLSYQMERWVNMADMNWYSADDHIHIRRSPRENPLILKWVEAEGLNVGVMLQMGDFWTTYFSQFAFGEDGVFRENDALLTTGQEEPRTDEIGHTIAMVADDFVRYRNDYYLYDNYFDKIHELNGVMGYAHQGMSFHGFRGMTLDVLAGKVDFLELMQFCVEGGPLITQNYYHFLDLGYKITATAGSDFPWCGNGPRYGIEGPSWNARIGNVRFYTHIDGEFGYDGWESNLKAGHTFATSGPMLVLNVEGKLPGDQINLNKKEKITIEAQAIGHQQQVPLTKLEIVAHGKVIAEIEPGKSGQSNEKLSIDMEFQIDKGQWIAARCYAGLTQAAHTTPVYVTINNQGFHNPDTMEEYLALNEKYLEELEAELEEPHEYANRRAWWYKKGLKKRIEDTRKVISQLKEKM